MNLQKQLHKLSAVFAKAQETLDRESAQKLIKKAKKISQKIASAEK